MSGCDFCEGDEGSSLLERARVIGVLDTWASCASAVRKHRTEWWGPTTLHDNKSWCCELDVSSGENTFEFWASTPDAARSAAAKAIETGEVP